MTLNPRAFSRYTLFLALIFGTAAFASGSYSTGGADLANQWYNLGKAVFYKKLICASCPLAQLEPDEDKAAVLVRQLTDNADFAQKLSDREREAVILYLQRRYGLD